MSMLPRELAEETEDRHLSQFAARSRDTRLARRKHDEKPDFCRTEFHRDYTRIIHSTAFRRLRNKTQVFVYPKNDHICTRLEHSIHVASVATTIAKALRLNTDLVNAIAVGHDLGHAPFGHKGEDCLSKIARERGLPYFHERQSLRVVDLLESPYYKKHNFLGLNLTFAVRDGIAAHYGEDYGRHVLRPDQTREEIPDDFEPGKLMPATLEGCVVRWADKIAYLGRDLDDAMMAGVVKRRDLPKDVHRVLGRSNTEIIGNLVRDIVNNSQGQSCVRVSSDVRKALNAFHNFSRERIYENENVQRPWKQIERSIRNMYDALVEAMESGGILFGKKAKPHNLPPVLRTLREFVIEDLHNQVDVSNEAERIVLDFIGGMTDNYFIQSYQELFLPHSTA